MCEPARIVRKHVKYPGNNKFQVFISYTHEDQAMSDYKRYFAMSDSIHKIEPEMLCDELNFFKAGIITEVTPLSYNVRDDRWTFKVFGYGVYNEKMTTKEIVRKYYFDKEEP